MYSNVCFEHAHVSFPVQVADFTWQSSHGAGPGLFVHHVPHDEGGEAHEQPERRVADVDVRLVDGHGGEKTRK